MWLKRKLKNRRHGRAHVLDVKLRSQQVRAERVRTVSSILLVSLGTLSGIFIALQGFNWATHYFVFDNDTYAVTKVDAQSYGVIFPAQLRRLTGVKAGDNLWALDLARVKRDLELVPWIQEAAVERVLPHTLRVRVTEREPMAKVCMMKPNQARGGYEMVNYYLDAAGFVMMPQGSFTNGIPLDALNESLPVLSDFDFAELRPGRQMDSEPVQAALRLIDAFEHSPMFGLVDLQQVELAGPEVLRVTTRQSNEVIFASQQLDHQMRRWRVVHDDALKKGRIIATLDLSVSNHTPATWAVGTGAPLPKPKAVKLTRNRKKDV